MVKLMDKKVLLLLIIFFITNAFFNSQFQLHYDEAYYWAWSKNIQLSYFDHPPMIAYLIKLTTLFNDSEFFVRLPALICTSITTLVVFKLALRMFDKQVANIAVILALAWPMLQGQFFIVTPDSPLFMFWAMTLYFFYIGVLEEKPNYIYLAGISGGLALLSKYIAFLVFPGLFLFLLFSNKYRYYLLRKEIYIAFFLSILLFTPVIIWNFNHNWVSFLFQVKHGLDGGSVRVATFFDYLGSQILVFNPIISLPLIYYLIRYRKINLNNDKLSFLLWPFLFVIIFFAFCSFFSYMGANWTDAAYISALIINAYWINYFNHRWIYISSLTLMSVVFIIIKLPTIFLPPKLHERISAINVFFGNQEMLNEVKPYLKDDVVMLGCDYGTASRGWYYLNKRVYVLNKFKYAHSYQYWNDGLNLPIKHAIFFCDVNDYKNIEILQQYFSKVELINAPVFKNNISENKLYIFEAKNDIK